MSAYDPPDEEDENSRHHPGVKEREITERREFSGVLSDLDRFDYFKIGILLSIPASIMTLGFVMILFPEYQDIASAIVRWLIESVTGVLCLTSGPPT